MSKDIIVPVILCGGSGTRLWPASRESNPKQFLSLTNNGYSLLQNTVKRVLRVCDVKASSLVVVTLDTFKSSVLRDLLEIDPALTNHILCEPSAQQTSAAVALAADYVTKTFGENAIMLILPADHHIVDEDALGKVFLNTIDSAKDGNIVTFGITPTRPDTGYGYIRTGSSNKTGRVYGVKQFVEKPDLETAQAYLESGEYLWNSGMFVFTAATVIDQYRLFARNILRTVQKSVEADIKNPDADIYAGIEKIPFDKAIIEKSMNVTVVPCALEWSDIGSWQSLWEISEKDESNNVFHGNIVSQNANGCMVKGKDKLIAVAGLDDIVIVETDDAILIAKREDADSLKALVTSLKEAGMRETAIPSQPRPAQPWSMVRSLPANEAFSDRPLDGNENILKMEIKKKIN